MSIEEILKAGSDKMEKCIAQLKKIWQQSEQAEQTP